MPRQTAVKFNAQLQNQWKVYYSLQMLAVLPSIFPETYISGFLQKPAAVSQRRLWIAFPVTDSYAYQGIIGEENKSGNEAIDIKITAKDYRVAVNWID